MCQSTLPTVVPPTGSLVLPATWVETVGNSYQAEMNDKKKNLMEAFSPGK